MHCMDKARLRSSEDLLLGACALGECCYGLGNRHWRQMCESPRVHLAEWHSLG